ENATTDFDDDALIHKAATAKNGDKFKLLWAGDYKAAGYASQSEADLALCGLLAFWCDGDRDRIGRLFRMSGLIRKKWERDDYRNRTIDRALSGKTEFYRSKLANKSDLIGLMQIMSGKKPAKDSQATQLVLMVERAGVELWHTPDGDTYATVNVGGHKEN